MFADGIKSAYVEVVNKTGIQLTYHSHRVLDNGYTVVPPGNVAPSPTPGQAGYFTNSVTDPKQPNLGVVVVYTTPARNLYVVLFVSVTGKEKSFKVRLV